MEIKKSNDQLFEEKKAAAIEKHEYVQNLNSELEEILSQGLNYDPEAEVLVPAHILQAVSVVLQNTVMEETSTTIEMSPVGEDGKVMGYLERPSVRISDKGYHCRELQFKLMELAVRHYKEGHFKQTNQCPT